jgi:signal transduction histidine kinase
LRAETGGRIVLGALPVVRTDPTLLRQLLQNLVSNALKYSREGVPPEVELRGEATAGGWCVAVADNGRGIPVENRAAVFELFTRLPETLSVSGSGIGLATCARIAEALHATIELGDTPGGGTTATVRSA